MNAKDREKVFTELFNDCLETARRKGRDYSTHADAEIDMNSNFKVLADMMGPNVDKYVVWDVYFMKHIMAIQSFIATRKLESEGIRGRILDAINYLAILESLIEEDKQIPDEDGGL
jgi:hypothetical protein